MSALRDDTGLTPKERSRLMASLEGRLRSAVVAQHRWAGELAAMRDGDLRVSRRRYCATRHYAAAMSVSRLGERLAALRAEGL